MLIEVNIAETVEVSDSVEPVQERQTFKVVSEMTGGPRVFVDWDEVIRQSERERDIHMVRGPPGEAL